MKQHHDSFILPLAPGQALVLTVTVTEDDNWYNLQPIAYAFYSKYCEKLLQLSQDAGKLAVKMAFKTFPVFPDCPTTASGTINNCK